MRTTPCSGRHAGLFVLNTHKVINLLSAVTNLLVAAACCSHSHDPDGKYVQPLNLNFGHLLPEPCCAATRQTRFLEPCICREEEPAHVSSCCRVPACPATFCAHTHARAHTHTHTRQEMRGKKRVWLDQFVQLERNGRPGAETVGGEGHTNVGCCTSG